MGDMPDQTQANGISVAKPVKLRESCDSCLIAKVKCGKERPLCKRCLTNGHNCVYSPSSKTGRRNHKNPPPKAAASAQEQISISTQTGSPLQSQAALDQAQSFFQAMKEADLRDSARALFNGEGPAHLDAPHTMHNPANAMAIDGGDMSSSSSSQPQLSDNPFISSDFIDPFMPMFDHEKGFDFSAAPISPSLSADHVTLGHPSPHNSNGGIQHPKSPFPFSPFARPKSSDRTARSPPTSSPSDNLQQRVQPCDCFAGCVQILQTLHKHSCQLSPTPPGDGPSFDLILNTNKDAIESCAAILGCTKCVSECGKSVVIMMLATVIGKVISLYRAACFLMFGSSNSMQSNASLAFGAYKVTGENRQLLEIEILLLELKRVAAVLMSYSERFCKGPSSEDAETGVYETLKSYLENNLRNVVQYLNAQKNSVSR